MADDVSNVSHEGKAKAVRIRCDEATSEEILRSLGDLKKEIHQWWLDGCICKLCSFFECRERGWFSVEQYESLLRIYLSVHPTRGHGDGFYPPGYSAVKAFRLGGPRS